MITEARLKELVTYDPETGLYHWRVSRAKTKAGALAGSYRPGKYVQLQLDGKNYSGHRLAFLYMTGSIPSAVDHINRDRADTRWANLRGASTAENARNQGKRPSKYSSLKGVTFNKSLGYWVAQIGCNGNKHLGYFKSEQAAHEAYVAASKKLHGEFSNTGG